MTMRKGPRIAVYYSCSGCAHEQGARENEETGLWESTCCHPKALKASEGLGVLTDNGTPPTWCPYLQSRPTPAAVVNFAHRRMRKGAKDFIENDVKVRREHDPEGGR